MVSALVELSIYEGDRHINQSFQYSALNAMMEEVKVVGAAVLRQEVTSKKE